MADSTISQFTGLLNKDAPAKASERPSDLIAQGTANGINAIVGSKGGEPPMANPGMVLADSTAGATAPKASIPANAIFSDGGGSSDQSKKPVTYVWTPGMKTLKVNK
jgi:filamentous hemagglutinin